MKRQILILLAIGAALAAGATAARADGIRDNPGYFQSTDLSIGGWTTVQPDKPDYRLSGWAVTSPFQLNLEYQVGIDNSDIDAFNAYDPDGTWTANFSDNEEYVLNLNPTGGLTIYEYDGLKETVDAAAQWTLTGWHQTILAGDIVNNGDGSYTLRVQPTATYRPFDGDVNYVEVFDADLDCEVLGYVFTGDISFFGGGTTLAVQAVPEPATMALFGLGGLAAVGRRIVRRRRRA